MNKLRPVIIYFSMGVSAFIGGSLHAGPSAAAVSKPVAPLTEAQVESQARAFYSQKKYQEVSDLVWRHIEFASRQSKLLLAKSEMLSKRLEQAMKVLNLLIAKDPKDYEAHTLLGGDFVLMKKTTEAVEEYKKAIEGNKFYQPAYEGIADIYVGKHNLYELRMIYQDMMEVFGARGEFLAKICEINTKDSVFVNAVHDCRKAIKIDENFPDNHGYLALSLKNSGEEAEASKVIAEAASRFKSSEFIQYTRGSFLEEEKNYIDAYHYYKAAVLAQPGSLKSLTAYANAAFEIQKYPESLQTYTKACELNKSTLPRIRKAAAALRKARNANWAAKFEGAADKCGGVFQGI